MKKKKGLLPLFLMLIACLVVAAVLTGILMIGQSRRNAAASEKTLENCFQRIETVFQNRNLQWTKANEKHYNIIQYKLLLLADLFEENGIGSARINGSGNVHIGLFSKQSLSSYESIGIIADKNGTILYCTSDTKMVDISTLTGTKVQDLLSLTNENWEKLRQGTYQNVSGEAYEEPRSEPITGALPNEIKMVCFSQPVTNSDLILIHTEMAVMNTIRNLGYMDADFANTLDDHIRFICFSEEYHITLASANDAYEYDSTESLGLTEEMIQDGYHGRISLPFFTGIIDTRIIPGYDTSPVIVVAMRTDPGRIEVRYLLWDGIVFLLIALMFVLYAFFLKDSHEAHLNEKTRPVGKRLYLRSFIAKKATSIAALGLVFSLLLSFVGTALFGLSSDMLSLGKQKDSIFQVFQNTYELQNTSRAITTDDTKSMVHFLGEYLCTSGKTLFADGQYEQEIPYYVVDSKTKQNKPLTDLNGYALSCITGSQLLQDTARWMNLSEITIYNLDGAAIITTGSEQKELLTQDSPFFDVLLRKSDYQSVTDSRNKTETIATPFYCYIGTDEAGKRMLCTQEEYEQAQEDR